MPGQQRRRVNRLLHQQNGPSRETLIGMVILMMSKQQQRTTTHTHTHTYASFFILFFSSLVLFLIKRQQQTCSSSCNKRTQPPLPPSSTIASSNSDPRRPHKMNPSSHREVKRQKNCPETIPPNFAQKMRRGSRRIRCRCGGPLGTGSLFDQLSFLMSRGSTLRLSDAEN